MTFFQILDHPADLAITFKAPNLAAVYKLAAIALFELLYESEPAKIPEQKTELEITAPDKEALLINWLNRLIFLHETQGLRGIEFKVNLVSEQKLTAEIGWQKVDFAIETPLREIKMATYHDLQIVPLGDMWEVLIIFDL